MLVMQSKITFPEVKGKGRYRAAMTIRRVSEVYTEASWKELTARAEIVLPRAVRDFDVLAVRDSFRRGDPLKIALGYNDKLVEEFTGYVTEVSADIPVRLKCEDEMWKLKQLPVNYVSKAATLDGLLRAICPGYEVDALEGVQLGAVRLAKTTAAKVLDKLRSDYGLFSYMKGKTLVCGKYYADDSEAAPVRFHLERGVVGHDLKYQRAEERLVKVTVKSISSKGERIQAQVGEDGGDTLDFTRNDIKDRASLEAEARRIYEQYKQDGYKGGFTAFGVPRVQHGWKAELVSDLYPERNGTYYVDAVGKTFGTGGYRQEVKIGGRVR